MLVKLNQTDGHVRVYEVRTAHHSGELALTVADGMRNGESADVCLTSYDIARGMFVNRVIRVEVCDNNVYTVVDGVRHYHGEHGNR